jgi:hypothetical protein
VVLIKARRSLMRVSRLYFFWMTAVAAFPSISRGDRIGFGCNPIMARPLAYSGYSLVVHGPHEGRLQAERRVIIRSDLLDEAPDSVLYSRWSSK